VPTARKPSGFKPIKPVPTIAAKPTNPNGLQAQQAPGQQAQQDNEEDINAVLADPVNKNRPEVRQIQSLLQRMKK
jgi:hypothetical protein